MAFFDGALVVMTPRSFVAAPRSPRSLCWRRSSCFAAVACGNARSRRERGDAERARARERQSPRLWFFVS